MYVTTWQMQLPEFGVFKIKNFSFKTIPKITDIPIGHISRIIYAVINHDNIFVDMIANTSRSRFIYIQPYNIYTLSIYYFFLTRLLKIKVTFPRFGVCIYIVFLATELSRITEGR